MENTATPTHCPYCALQCGTHLSLDGDRLTEMRAEGTVTERELADEAEARRVVAEEFGVEVPEGLRPPG